jgi:hypothetical protein
MNLKRSNRQTTRTANACGQLVDIMPFGVESPAHSAAPRRSLLRGGVQANAARLASRTAHRRLVPIEQLRALRPLSA